MFYLVLILFKLMVFVVAEVSSTCVSGLPPPGSPRLRLTMRNTGRRFPLRVARKVMLGDLRLGSSTLMDAVRVSRGGCPFRSFLQGGRLGGHLVVTGVTGDSPFRTYDCRSFTSGKCSTGVMVGNVRSRQRVILITAPGRVGGTGGVSSAPERRLSLCLGDVGQGLPGGMSSNLAFSSISMGKGRFLFVCVVSRAVCSVGRITGGGGRFGRGIRGSLGASNRVVGLTSLLTPLSVSLEIDCINSVSGRGIGVSVAPTCLGRIISSGEVSGRFG